ncbi:unnamed protein product [Peronospora belbahrii]|uniref:Uncharacterized protein n=1 Tax=Peronospora belbahrii TaxID=622444 RepID=A0ABN8D4S3_9STRA|nr:unnamed protein product [Peronospora belbahrii]
MGNTCTRNSESQVVLTEHGVILQNRRTEREQDRARGRWSAPNVESVDLDTLLEAPSPSKKEGARRRRKKRQSLSERFHRHAPSIGRPPRPPSFNEPNPLNRSRVHRSHTEAVRRPIEDDPTPIYHSYEDPGYLAGDPIQLQQFDADCILGSPINSPSVIHARWGEPVDDPDEENLCTDFSPNPFKLGFCINCMKQHDVQEDGVVASSKEYKRIARPTIAKTAANALELPSAIPIPRSSITMMPEGGRESDIDLAQLLAQRRDVLMRLDKLDREKMKLKRNQSTGGTMGRRADRHTTINFGENTRGNLRRMNARPPGSGPIISCGTTVTLAPQPATGFGASKIKKKDTVRTSEQLELRSLREEGERNSYPADAAFTEAVLSLVQILSAVICDAAEKEVLSWQAPRRLKHLRANQSRDQLRVGRCRQFQDWPILEFYFAACRNFDDVHMPMVHSIGARYSLPSYARHCQEQKERLLLLCLIPSPSLAALEDFISLCEAHFGPPGPLQKPQL